MSYYFPVMPPSLTTIWHHSHFGDSQSHMKIESNWHWTPEESGFSRKWRTTYSCVLSVYYLSKTRAVFLNFETVKIDFVFHWHVHTGHSDIKRVTYLQINMSLEKMEKRSGYLEWTLKLRSAWPALMTLHLCGPTTIHNQKWSLLHFHVRLQWTGWSLNRISSCKSWTNRHFVTPWQFSWRSNAQEI